MSAGKLQFVEASTCIGRESMCFYPEMNQFVSYTSLVGGHCGYLVMVFLLKLIMGKRSPFSLKYPMMAYNALQVVLSVTMAIGLAPFLKFNFFNIDGKFNGTVEFWIFVHYMTKFLDMFDTFFMVLRKKDEQLSFLHIYHHLTIGFIWGLLLHHGIGNGTAFFGAWINSCVHALMYFHYLYTSLGYQNPLKKYLTQIQMIQFGLCILQAIMVVMWDHQIPTSWALLQFGYHMSLLYLFMQFYKRSIKKSRKSSTNGSLKKKD